jgi:UDP-glucose 4-epimerase
VRESDPPLPDSPYAVSKWAAEQYIHTIGALWGQETVALRVFNAYGPGQSLPASHAPVVPRFLLAARSGGSLMIYGDGRQTRDFVYVDDVVDALVAAATARGVNRQVINIGCGQETSVTELVTAVEQATDRKVNVLHNAQKAGGVARLSADIGRARELLGFEPKVGLAEGLRLTVERDRRYQGDRV